MPTLSRQLRQLRALGWRIDHLEWAAGGLRGILTTPHGTLIAIEPGSAFLPAELVEETREERRERLYEAAYHGARANGAPEALRHAAAANAVRKAGL
ncbi:MAG: hypothetical protein AB7V42_06235 [Thermoleophilia bacterium]